MKLAMVARWKPVHLGHQRVLHGLQQHSSELTLVIGSANRYDADNPFTAEETEEMLHLTLLPGLPVRLLRIDDLNDPPRWASRLAAQLGPLDAFVTANPAVADPMSLYYRIVHPVQFVAPELRVAIEGKMVRRAWRENTDWQSLVPREVSAYIEHRRLVQRFLSL